MNKMQYLVLIRHGQSAANSALLKTSACGFYYSVSGADRSVPLTRKGLGQADRAGVILSCLFDDVCSFWRAYHSSFKRVTATLSRIESRLAASVCRILDNRLDKRDYGLFWNLTRQGVEALYPAEWRRYSAEGELHYRPPGGENYADLFERVDRFFDEEIDGAAENVLVITHSVVVLALLRRLEGLTDAEVVRRYEEMDVPNGEPIIFCRRGRSKNWRRAPGALFNRAEKIAETRFYLPNSAG